MFISLSDEEFLRRVTEILKTNGLKHSDIAGELEEHFKRSFSTISKRFRRCTGLSVFEAHDRMIARIAKERLKKQSCTEVLYDLGFKNESYFSRWFRKHTGTNPAMYRINSFN